MESSDHLIETNAVRNAWSSPESLFMTARLNVQTPDLPAETNEARQPSFFV